jgi:hypothetical protein
MRDERYMACYLSNIQASWHCSGLLHSVHPPDVKQAATPKDKNTLKAFVLSKQHNSQGYNCTAVTYHRRPELAPMQSPTVELSCRCMQKTYVHQHSQIRLPYMHTYKWAHPHLAEHTRMRITQTLTAHLAVSAAELRALEAASSLNVASSAAAPEAFRSLL